MSKTERKIVTLFGNVGKDPEIRPIPGKEVTRWVYDEVVDAVVEKTFDLPERELRTFSIAINYRDPETQEEMPARWKYCEDWKGFCAANLVRQGDRVQLTGYSASACSRRREGSGRPSRTSSSRISGCCAGSGRPKWPSAAAVPAGAAPPGAAPLSLPVPLRSDPPQQPSRSPTRHDTLLR